MLGKVWGVCFSMSNRPVVFGTSAASIVNAFYVQMCMSYMQICTCTMRRIELSYVQASVCVTSPMNRYHGDHGVVRDDVASENALARRLTCDGHGGSSGILCLPHVCGLSAGPAYVQERSKRLKEIERPVFYLYTFGARLLLLSSSQF